MKWHWQPNAHTSSRDAGFSGGQWLVAMGGLMILIVAGLWLTRSGDHQIDEIRPEAPVEPVITTPRRAFTPIPRSAVSEETSALVSESAPTLPVVVSAPPSQLNLSGFPRTEATPHARELVGYLANLPLAGGVLSAAQAGVWKERLQELVALGEGAVPAIREFLEKNLDIAFDGMENRDLLGHSTLRTALLSALLQVGGTEALGVALQTLQTTADPMEIAMLAKYLSSTEAPEYRDAVLTATREALALAASGQWDGRDVGPLLDILKHLGGPEAANALAGYANTWFNYVPLTLADLPDGAGIPVLIQLVENPGGAVTLGHDLYQRMLAQTAAQYPEAAAALLRQVEANRISPTAWAGIASALAGNTVQISASPLTQPTAGLAPSAVKGFHVAIGNQNFVEVPRSGGLSGDQIQQNMQLIDRLLGTTGDASAITQLQQARAQLAQRLSPAGS